MHRVAALIVVLLVLSVPLGCSRPQEPSITPTGPTPMPSAQETIKINGSDTMVNLGQAWAEEFMKQNPGVSVEVTGGGSGTGIAAMIDGRCDIAQASRKMKDNEIQEAESKGRSPLETQVAWDGLAVVVHSDNPVSELTIDQLSDIFTGKVTNWSEVGGADEEIVLLSRESNSGTHVYFKENVLRKGDKESRAEYAASALLQPSSQAIHDEVMNNPQAIGYFGLGYVDEQLKAIKVATEAGQEAVEPNPENVTSGAYPISRPLQVYTNGEPSGVIKQYIDFCLSADGQQVVSELDFVPL